MDCLSQHPYFKWVHIWIHIKCTLQSVKTPRAKAGEIVWEVQFWNSLPFWKPLHVIVVTYLNNENSDISVGSHFSHTGDLPSKFSLNCMQILAAAGCATFFSLAHTPPPSNSFYATYLCGFKLSILRGHCEITTTIPSKLSDSTWKLFDGSRLCTCQEIQSQLPRTALLRCMVRIHIDSFPVLSAATDINGRMRMDSSFISLGFSIPQSQVREDADGANFYCSHPTFT